MSDFRRLSDSFAASPQITEADVAEAKRRGFATIVNNRPEGEAEDQTPGDAIERAAHENGLGYAAIPITHAGFSEPQVDALLEAMNQAEGPILGYCRSGTRSTLLWALARAKAGDQPKAITAQAQAAGYDVASIAPLLDMFSARNRD